MAYIFGLIVVALLFLALHYFTELSREQKIITAVVFFLFVFGAISYNSYRAQEQERILEVAKKFQQQKEVICNGKVIDRSLYDLSVGTYTFIGKENTSVYAEMIPLDNCH